MKIDTNTFTETDFRLFISAHTWKFAKTMPQHPHEYVLRERARSDAEFLEAALFIQETGVSRKWFRQRYTYLEVDGWEYWAMWEPKRETRGSPQTSIINRARVVKP